jgi:predicted dehydrogenase
MLRDTPFVPEHFQEKHLSIDIAFAGFRHGHILDLYKRAGEMDRFSVVAACEEDAGSREQLLCDGNVSITHDSYAQMLDEVPCDAVAVGDYYGKRGEIIIQALQRGKHVISDKPICTSIEQLDQIESLAMEKNLKVGCMLDLRDSGVFVRVRKLVRDGVIGEVHGVCVLGHHPLLLGTRPNWYFEEGKHGGTINDIGIHAFDLIPWITGLQFREIVAARSWNAFATDFPHFKDAGQFMLTMDNGCGVIGDVSYFMPDSMGYTLDIYWRITIFGRKGVIEASITSPHIKLARHGSGDVELIEPGKGNPGGYLRSFLRDHTGESAAGLLTANVLQASRVALMTERAGNERGVGSRLIQTMKGSAREGASDVSR